MLSSTELVEAPDAMIDAEGAAEALNTAVNVGNTEMVLISVNISMNFDLCEQVQFICFSSTNADRASYTEITFTNNIICYDINVDKECYPGKLFNHTSVTNSTTVSVPD